MIDIWFINNAPQINIDDYNNLFNKKLYITINESIHLNALEAFVYNIAIFHINRLNYKDNIVIEYSLNNLNNFINNYEDENEDLLTTVTYLSYNNNPIVISNLDSDMYTYKEVPDNIKLMFIFPELFKHIAIEPNNNFYRQSKIFDNLLEDNIQLIVTLRKNVYSENIPHKSRVNSDLSFFNYDKNIITVKRNIINKSLMHDILYNIEKQNFREIKDYFENEISSNRTFSYITDDNPNNKPNCIPNDNERIINVKLESRFIQRKIINNFYNINVCDWIYKEFYKFLQTNSILIENRTIELEKFTPIFAFYTNSFDTIETHIKNTYSLNDNIRYNIKKLFIEVNEYEESPLSNEENYNENCYNNDNSCITVKILLNDKLNYHNNGIQFEDKVHSHLNKGDMIIYSGFVKYKETKIQKGIKVYLVSHIDLITDKIEEWWEKEVLN